MKRWDVSDELRADPVVAEKVTRLRPLVEEILGKSSPFVEANWTVRNAAGDQRTLALRLSDWTSPKGVEQEFADDELVASTSTRWKLHRLWGDLLQARNHRQLAELLKAE